MKHRRFVVLLVVSAGLALSACHHSGGGDRDGDGGPHRGGHWDGGAHDGHRGHAPTAGSAAPAPGQ